MEDLEFEQPSDAYGFDAIANITAASSEQEKRKSLISEVMQAQLLFWTLIGGLFHSYAWQQHRKKFLLSLFFVVPTVLLFCLVISSLLTTIVILGRIFSTPFRFDDMLSFGGTDEPAGERRASRRHVRTLSINSNHSSISTFSLHDDVVDSLPKPMCRKHSTSNGSLNQLSFRPTSPPNYFNGSNGKSPPPHRLSYQFSHRSGGENECDT